MTRPLRVLVLEDRAADAGLMLRELRLAGFAPDWRRVDREEDYLAHLDPTLDLILADYHLPQFDALSALHHLQDRGLDVPFVVVTGAVGEEEAVECMKQGAADYLLKDRLGRLGQAVQRALAERELRKKRQHAEEALRAKSEELKAMSQQLWQAAKLATMGELAASIAHELNNPLGIVSLRVESLLEETPPDDRRRRALEIIAQEVDRMGNLVANLLQFSRRSSQRISTVDVRAEIENTLEFVQYHLRSRRIAVVRELAPDVPAIQADSQQLRQLFLNLFTNASDAMPEGGTLTIRVSVSTPGSTDARDPTAFQGPTISPEVVIEIADTGAGIAPEHLSKVMEPFFTTKGERGTGLGLPICRRIVHEHHGSLDITSTLGQGTTVRISLPAANGANGARLRETSAGNGPGQAGDDLPR